MCVYKTISSPYGRHSGMYCATSCALFLFPVLGILLRSFGCPPDSEHHSINFAFFLACCFLLVFINLILSIFFCCCSCLNCCVHNLRLIFSFRCCYQVNRQSVLVQCTRFSMVSSFDNRQRVLLGFNVYIQIQ